MLQIRPYLGRKMVPKDQVWHTLFDRRINRADWDVTINLRKFSFFSSPLA